MTLTLKKCYFVYFFIQILSYYIFKFELNITKKKIQTIRQIKFLTNLRDLKINLKFFEYYRFFVNYYVNIVKFLV